MMVHSMCAICTRLRDHVGAGCEAFPDGIPQEIVHNQFDHRKEFPGDNGFRFEQIVPRDEKEQAFVDLVVAKSLLSGG